MNQESKELQNSVVASCDPSIVSRKEFVEKIVNKAAVAGTLIYGAGIVDSFVAPPARAATSGTQSVQTVTKTDIGVLTSTVVDTLVAKSTVVVTTTVFTSFTPSTITTL